VGRNGSSGVLIMSLSAIIPEKSRGNKNCEEEAEGQNFGLFGIGLKYPCTVVGNFFVVYMFILLRSAC